MEQFIGIWKLVDCDKNNFNDYMEALGVSLVTRKAASVINPSLIITKNGDTFCMKTESTIKNHSIDFKLEEEFAETTADGRKALTTITLTDGKLIQVQNWDSKTTTITREVIDEKLFATCIMGEVKCVRVYCKK
uniref:Lipocalin/cytosolic fatty-acid binding domain-containing protein n=1 Tax=Leptobrachium leishanense TaxID=445787 RepID=A0A8C5QV47_9ANUR